MFGFNKKTIMGMGMVGVASVILDLLILGAGIWVVVAVLQYTGVL